MISCDEVVAGLFQRRLQGAALIVLGWFSLFEYALFNGTIRIIKELRKTIGISTGLIEEESEEDEEEEEDDEEDDEDDDDDE